MNHSQIRHGDVFLQPIEDLPAGARRIKGKVLAEGEATGHAHRIEGPGTLYLGADGQLYLRATRETSVVHEEHKRATIAPGTYKVIGQREYQPAAAPRRVVD